MIDLLHALSKRLLRVEPEQDSRPEVVYKPFLDIKVGQQAVISSSQHEVVITDTVIAYDKHTGSFETRRVRYVLDKSYLH